ncbi:hypothetical protein EMCG_04422 [[Emmonsia] crescens]|uniref:Uncharacterized protein n=1 Tax=[Emmonsia] crescens TaxID=73230 RepID=A0A0G2HSE1_9EURO|nr:hypothetical protein EMCG_04422 [Emmonsia crescens UAMH 3008]
MTEAVLASPLLTPASASDISTLSELIDTLPKDPPAKFALLTSRDDTEYPTEDTNLMAARELQTTTNKRAEQAAGYAGGMCSIHLWETEVCGFDRKTERYARLLLRDNGGAIIAQPNNGLHGGKGTRIDQTWEVTSQLPYVLLIDGNGSHNNVQFRYGAHSWMSNTGGKKGQRGNPYCIQGGWDPRERAWNCAAYTKLERHKQMDCYFPC